MVSLRCVKCGDYLNVPESASGTVETCPNCGNVAVVPDIRPSQQEGASATPVAVAGPVYVPYAPGAVSSLVRGIIAVLLLAFLIIPIPKAGRVFDLRVLLYVFPVIAIAPGLRAVRDAKEAKWHLTEYPTKCKGRGMASAGQVLGWIVTVVYLGAWLCMVLSLILMMIASSKVSGVPH